MSVVANVGPVVTNPAPANSRSVDNNLGKDDFLNLLVTQLRYQDPMNPMDNTQFIAQMAQFSSLEQMKNMTEGLAELQKTQEEQLSTMNNVLTQLMGSQSQFYSVTMIGKNVEATVPKLDEQGNALTDGSTEILSGQVTGVRNKNGVSLLVVNGKIGETTVTREVKMTDLQSITNAQ
ncbi:flagellar hook capping FlgD N-terminal domain-containing protein [Heliophilum fasciatum]|uniref:Flagellar basal-body rod modification protein FlgD n=1 Tax=Heliophilum fasciatum TaxID=35700 RepID=A0A4R2RKQ9_9FIRM|nr:flagellar hook capping FlgD N-terminal domain-containing protein [Heliophilum fasciatum]MCW2277938.1 flagellar basal-body rod modification protein FlgD [Heliophilum fasciatum]TCP64492.1 flagellar basal-body rod modification protein FlgD [Heliophilum fasciatum]